MFEHRSDPLLSRHRFFLRLLRNIGIGVGLIAFGLLVGTLGYCYLEHLPAVDALLNATMLLTCMGPAYSPLTTGGKLFASAYAIFSGVAFPTTIGIMMAPAVHRFLHKLHLDEGDDDEEDGQE